MEDKTMSNKINKITKEKNTIKQDGKVKYFQPILGCSFNYLLGMSDGSNKVYTRPSDNIKVVSNRFEYNT